MLNKQELIQMLSWEANTTAKVIRALPEDKLSWRPHERSRTAEELLKTLIAETVMMNEYMHGNQGEDPYKDIRPFASVEEGVGQYEQYYRQLITAMQASPEEDFSKPFNFFGRDTNRADAIFNIILDIIHHRGQLSVYVRLAGGKVPAIYGPSADEEYVG